MKPTFRLTKNHWPQGMKATGACTSEIVSNSLADGNTLDNFKKNVLGDQTNAFAISNPCGTIKALRAHR